MDIEKAYKVVGIIFKVISIVCITAITFIYWQRKDIGKYQDVSKEDGIIIVFNTQTGDYTAVGDRESKTIRKTIIPFAKDKTKIFGNDEIIKSW